MARLRIRLELNRRSAGVPLDKLASVVEETRKFFHLLAEDVHLNSDHSEWVASDFDPESLNFTAEYSGAVTTEQVRAFGAAFAGATSLRRATIAQFTRIADFLGEDELVGFGLYQSDTESEPSEWRCLSKRDAQRFGQEIRMLAEAAGEALPETSLPAVMNGSIAGRRLFKDRREREALAADPAKLLREMETNLSRRIDLLEGEVQLHSRKLRLIGPAPDQGDERFQKLLSAMEKFWTQAPRQTPLLPAPEASAPPASAPIAAETASKSEALEAKQEAAVAVAEEPAPKVEAPPVPVEKPVVVAPPEPRLEVPIAKKSKRWWVFGSVAAAAVALGLAFPALQSEWSEYTAVQSIPIVAPKPPAAPTVTKIEVKADVRKPIETKLVKAPQRFEGPQIALDLPADVRAKVSADAQVKIIIAIDDQGNVTNAEVASTRGKGARLLTKEALAAARRSRFRPAREGERAVDSQMVLTYLFKSVKPESAEF